MRVTGLLGLIVLGLLLAPAAGTEKGKLEPAKLVGTWTYVSGEKDGKKIPGADLQKGTVQFTRDKITLKSPEGTFVLKYQLDPAKSPCRIKMEITEGPQGAAGSKADGIIALKGSELKLCYPPMDGAAPKDFTAKEGSGHQLFILKRKA
jgi:uncharacterized protein (TIGR03067 family)